MLKRFYAALRSNGPDFLQPGLAKLNAMRKHKIRNDVRKNRPVIKVEDVIGPLRDNDLAGDFIIHAGIGNIGKLDESPAVLLDGLLEIAAKGTILFPALPFDTMMYEYLEKLDMFSVADARNCMGVISTLAQKRNCAIRSSHPTHSTIALGSDSLLYTSNHHLDDSPFGVSSPFRMLSDKKGTIILLGVGLNSVTNMHVHEDMALNYLPYEVYLDKSYSVLCKGSDGLNYTVSVKCHSPKLSAVRNCERVRSELLRQSVMRTYKVGANEVSLINASQLDKTLLSLLLAGNSIYGSVSLTKAQSDGIKKILNENY